jgi:sigma-E factor negative regulatory protein RseB
VTVKRILIAGLLALGPAVVCAQSAETLGWLRKIQDATEKLSYAGTFIYHQNGGRSETSKITRYVHAAGNIEKLEVIDGMPREIVRTKDSVRCYLPGSRLVKVDRRTERDFPGLLPERITALARHYEITLGETRRIANYDCQAVVLTPRDDLRYGYHLYADVNTGMLLRAVTVDASGAQIEQFSFTELRIGGVTRDMVRTRHAASRNWRVEDAAAAPARLAGWGLSSELPGFQKVIELKRRLGESRSAGQVVYSDGLAAVSVFIESLEGRSDPVRTGLSSMGAIHIYTREVANHMVTVVGETPAASVQRIANAVEYRKP